MTANPIRTGAPRVEYLKRAEVASKGTRKEVTRTVSQMLLRIEREGEAAVRDYSRRFDRWDPPTFHVSEKEVRAARDQIGKELRAHIAFAQDQVRGFAELQRATLSDLEVETLPGVTLGHRHIPVRAVGAYVPGGHYPMLASSFMTVIVAKVAGVSRVVASAPPHDRRGIHPAVLHAIATSGADEILCLGGVQALAAMAFGMSSLAPVDMIVGAGNAYVAEAKRQLFGCVGVDLLAGPTEVLVIVDESADVELAAADLLGQAEHGPTSRAVLISTSRATAGCVSIEVDRLLDQWPTSQVAGEAWRSCGEIVVVQDQERAVELANSYAFEHVEVHVADRDLAYYFDRLHNYGSLFLGREATVAYGDKAVGTNHVLPTQRAARYTGGLWVGKFLKTVTHQQLTERGTACIAPAVAAISEAELFAGHAITARMRLERCLRPRVIST